MIIVIAENVVPAEKRAEYMEALDKSGIVKATNEESGCISYDLSASSIYPDRVYVVERWEGMAQLQGHMKGENFAALGKLNKSYVTDGKFNMYKAEEMK